MTLASCCGACGGGGGGGVGVAQSSRREQGHPQDPSLVHPLTLPIAHQKIREPFAVERLLSRHGLPHSRQWRWYTLLALCPARARIRHRHS